MFAGMRGIAEEEQGLDVLCQRFTLINCFSYTKVDQHCYKCRECWILSCIDCGKQFEGDAYKQHTSCISEAQKYQGHLFKTSKVVVVMSMISMLRLPPSVPILHMLLVQ